MANNTEQDKMDILIRELYTLSAQDIEPHHFAVKARQLIEAEATRREQAARIDELTSLRAITLSNSVVDDNGDPIHPPTSLDEAVLNRIAELKRLAEGGKG